MEALLVIFVVGICLLPIAASSSSSGAGAGAVSSGVNSGKKETVVIQQPAQQTPQPPSRAYRRRGSPPIDIQQQQLTPQHAENTPQDPAPNSQSAIQRFAIKNYSKIDADNKKGGGEYLNSLVTLMESEDIPKAEALVFIKQALRKANGNAEIFGEQIEKFME